MKYARCSGVSLEFPNGVVSSAPSPKSLGLRCVQNGPPARREEGAYLNRYVTDEQRGRRPIFNATLRAAASWLFFRVARSAVMIQIAALRSRLEKQPTDLRRSPRDLGGGALDRDALVHSVPVGLTNHECFGAHPARYRSLSPARVRSRIRSCSNRSRWCWEPRVLKVPQKEPRKLGAFVVQSAANDIDEPEVPLHSPH